MIRPLLISLIAILAAVVLPGQVAPESVPSTRGGLEGLNDAMTQLREGRVQVSTLRLVVDGLASSGHPFAIPWWITLAEQGLAARGGTAADREALARLKRDSEKPGTFADERKVTLRVVRQAEALVADKDFARAGRAIATARCLLQLVPDATISRSLEAAEKRIPAKAPAGGSPCGASRLPADVEAEGQALCGRLIESALRDYGEAGCRPGRQALVRIIRQTAAFCPAEEVGRRRNELRSLATKLEPSLVVRIFVRTSHAVHVFCDGRPIEIPAGVTAIDASKQPPFDVPALPGDHVTIVLDEAYAANPGTGQIWFVGLNAGWNAAGVDPTHVFYTQSEDPLKPVLPLKPAPRAKKSTNPPESMFGRNGDEYDAALRASNTWFTMKNGANVPGYADVMEWQREFESRKLIPVWYGEELPEGSRFALVLELPDD